MKEVIYEVNDVNTTLQANLLRVTAAGETTTTGWSGGELRFDGREDDTLVFTFVATPPEGIIIPIFTPIESAPFEIPLMPPFFPHYVRVRAAHNEIRVAIGKELVYEVTSGTAVGRGPAIEVSANGMTTENDWTDAELVLQPGCRYEYWFMARRGGALPVLTPIAAGPEETLVRLPYPQQVAIKARTNKIDVGVNDAEKQRILHVDAAHAKLSGNMLVVEAHGETSTAGWSEPELRLASSSEETYIFDFVALPPNGPVAQVLTPISVRGEFGPMNLPFNAKVIVRAELNEVVASQDAQRPADANAQKELVYRVDSVEASWNGQYVETKANGIVVSSGYTQPELRLLRRTNDTIFFSFLALRPQGPAIPVIEEISASASTGPEMPLFPSFVVVFSATNAKRVRIENAAAATAKKSSSKQPQASA
ncbi:MAG: hypothetical protein JO197_14445 [Acidobacteria bacterium]|nr:hypothetical protein [Acidobacteriota bacterium]MBV9478745.1 hypothetical protein [Acidobacteriota bacterium]